MEILIFWIGFSIAVGFFASSRGRSGFGWFLLACIISPLLAIIFAAIASDLTKQKEAAPTPETHIKCPDCRELIIADARKCRYCGCALIPQNTSEN